MCIFSDAVEKFYYWLPFLLGVTRWKYEQKIIPENEYEEHQQHAEGGHVVHGLYQNH